MFCCYFYNHSRQTATAVVAFLLFLLQLIKAEMLKSCPWLSAFIRQSILPTCSSNTWVWTMQYAHKHKQDINIYMAPSSLVLPLFLTRHHSFDSRLLWWWRSYCTHFTALKLASEKQSTLLSANVLWLFVAFVCKGFQNEFAKVPICIPGNKRHLIYIISLFCILFV